MATSKYDKDIAYHYQAYRPPLHQVILNKALGNSHVLKGLDIGSGLGHSSIALAQWCDEVIGIDPNDEMQRNTLIHDRVKYAKYSPGPLPFPDNEFGIITFAGSWFYAQSPDMIQETERVLKPGGRVLCYDFSIDLIHVMDILEIDVPETSYDHLVNFDAYDHQLVKAEQVTEKITLGISFANLAHLLLAEEGWRNKLPVSKQPELVSLLLHSGLTDEFTAMIYFTTYDSAGE